MEPSVSHFNAIRGPRHTFPPAAGATAATAWLGGDPSVRKNSRNRKSIIFRRRRPRLTLLWYGWDSPSSGLKYSFRTGLSKGCGCGSSTYCISTDTHLNLTTGSFCSNTIARRASLCGGVCNCWYEEQSSLCTRQSDFWHCLLQ